MYSHTPKIVGQFDIDCTEFMLVQYMPIVFPGTEPRVPFNLLCFAPLIRAAYSEISPRQFIYLTVKSMFVGPGCSPNRPGWHIDGFGTDDINYIWSDRIPTEFCIQDFSLSNDHEVSMLEMQAQAQEENIVIYPDNSLLMLDSTIVHRVGKVAAPTVRTFVKISLSKQVYNLRGNAHNHMFDYSWAMVDRQTGRNHPIGGQP